MVAGRSLTYSVNSRTESPSFGPLNTTTAINFMNEMSYDTIAKASAQKRTHSKMIKGLELKALPTNGRNKRNRYKGNNKSGNRTLVHCRWIGTMPLKKGNFHKIYTPENRINMDYLKDSIAPAYWVYWMHTYLGVCNTWVLFHKNAWTIKISKDPWIAGKILIKINHRNFSMQAVPLP